MGLSDIFLMNICYCHNKADVMGEDDYSGTCLLQSPP